MTVAGEESTGGSEDHGLPARAQAEILDTLHETLLDGSPEYTRVEVTERAGVPLELAQELWHALGFPHSRDDEVVFTETDVEALRKTKELIDAGVMDEDSRTALVRTWGRSFSRLAEWQVLLLAKLAEQASQPERGVDQITGEVLPLVEWLQAYVWRRHLFSTSARLLLRPDSLDSAVESVGFVDIVGYTSQSRNLSEEELVDLVEHFEDVSASVVTDHGGQVVKTIGDEILFLTPSAEDAAGVALTLVEAHREDEAFPKVRAGIAYGDVVSRLGDVYGPTVNVAARLTSAARPGRVLADRGVYQALRDDEGDRFRFRRLRRASVKGYNRLEMYRIQRGRGSEEAVEPATDDEPETSDAETTPDAFGEAEESGYEAEDDDRDESPEGEG